MFKKIRESRATRIFCFFMAINILAEIISPNMAFALTSGPSQPEVQTFEPINTSEMVDLFSGDFKYNIPLMDVGGYPLNICYNSGVGMDQEASWVGLGWNLNVGSINRSMRGLPDDFNGEDIVEKEFNTKDNITYGANTKFGFEIFGWEGPKSSGASFSMGLGIRYNNYTGISVENSTGFGLSAGNANKGSMNAGLGITSSADEGLNISPSVSFSSKTGKSEHNEGSPSIGGGISLGINSRSGLKTLSFNSNVSPGNKGYIRSGLDDDANIQIGRESQQSGVGLSSGFTVNYATPTYVPQINYPMLNSSIAISTKLGVHLYGFDLTFDIGGYYSKQRLATKNIYSPAYGYMYSEVGQFNENAMHDFNREKDGGFSPGMEFLPPTNNTYDVYSVMGQGVGGTYRPFRNDVGNVYDPEVESISDSYSIGTDVAAGNLVKVGTDIGVVDVHTTTGKWNDANSAQGSMFFAGGGRLAEAAYFKEVGEKSVESDPTRFGAVGGFDPVRVKLTGPAMFAKASAEFEKQDLSNGNIASMGAMPVNFARAERDKRNKVISTLTLGEVQDSPLGFESGVYTTTPSLSPYICSDAKSHHIYEVSVLKADGSRYIYGLPAYNKVQEEVSMNVSGNTIASGDYALGLIDYANGSDDSKNNSKGIDNFYSRTKLPAYAYAYMLTAVVSADYVDVTGNGPSDDDLGEYTRFGYAKVSDYEWRTPAYNGKVNYNENTKAATPGDDYGNYIWGKKDLFYVSDITTKNYYAKFDLGDRKDGHAVNETGVRQGLSTQLLKKITLYSKKDWVLHNTAAVPIKTANFVYDYSLCTAPGFSSGIDDVPNNDVTSVSSDTELSNDGGKLTLKQIYFTYGSSEKAKFSKYEFEYNDLNPSYDPKAYDRWGNYKPNPVTTTTMSPAAAISATGNVLPTWEYPYTEQYKPSEDSYASAWSLTTIKLPSGAEINVDYESDDYAYVQNLPAMDMFQVTGCGSTSTPSAEQYSITAPGGVTQLMDYSGLSVGTSSLYLYFKLDTVLSTGTYTTQTLADNYVKSHYIRDMVSGRYMYFRFLMNLTLRGTPGIKNLGNYFEYISGYAELDDFGAINDGSGYSYGYVRLKSVDIGKNKSSANVHPICKAAWQTGRTQFSQLVWDANFTPGGGAIDVVKSIVNASMTKNIFEAFTGPNRALEMKDYGKEFVRGKSWIRLYDPNGIKMGGGSRVKTLTINDQWDDITSSHQFDFTYGQQFSYTKVQDGECISSGVASYEPILGNDENPFRLPNYYRSQGNNPLKNAFLINDDRFYKEEPYGESFFPAASVGYSDVRVMNLERTNGEPYPYTSLLVDAHATGYVVHKFYTAKDYPTLTYRTKLDKKIFKPAFGSLFKIAARDYMTTSQGYVVETNDMHGKPKAIETYQQGKPNDPISKIEYFYKTEGPNGYEEPTSADIYNDARLKSNHLSNSCNVITTTGSVVTRDIGVDYDVVSDFRENETNTIQAGIQANVSVFLVAVYPAVAVTIWPDFSYEKTRFRSAVVTKVINRYGILEKTVATDLGSRIETANMAYDYETGDPLLTRTNNEFDDPVYSFSYPSHWAYSLMGQAYKNIGAYLSDIAVSTGVASITVAPTTASNYFTTGDEVSLFDKSSGKYTKAWVCSVGTPSSNNFSLIDISGAAISTGTFNVKVVRSGRRNQQVLPIGSVVSLVNPIATSTISFDKVTKTSAVEFSDQWGITRGHEHNSSEATCCEINQYGIAMYNLINALNSAGKLFPGATTGEQLWSSPTYTYSDFQILNNYPSTTDWAGWYSSASTATNAINFGVVWQLASSPTATCVMQAVLNPTLNWSTVIAGGINSFNGYKIIPSGGCDGVNGIKICMTYNSSSTACFTLTSTGGCWDDFGNCPKPGNVSNVDCHPRENDVRNPYTNGIKGNWRTQKSWAYLAPRAQTTATNSNTDIRKDGYFCTAIGNNTALFSPFWNYSVSVNSFTPNTSSWTSASQVTKYNPFNGAEVENKDALGRYSSAVYGYNETLPIIVASNAKYNEVGFDGFEDYGLKYTSDCRKSHFNFYEYQNDVTDDESHTGVYSMSVTPGGILSAKRTVVTPSNTAYNSACTYSLVYNDFNGQFAPLTSAVGGQKYIMSYWVKEKLITSPTSTSTPVLSYLSSNIAVSMNSTGTPTVLSASNVKRSQLIDGWQRVEYTFVVPVCTTNYDITVSLQNSSPSGGPTKCKSYFDDVRIHPFTSNIKTFVYHPVNLRFVAELDANNFATFYEYNEEGSLIRTKKETEKGIMTLKENKNHTKR
jgi:hypothetical protein